ncbi:MAG: DNA polymerase III subunit alpha [Verrucomicrobiota bacterium]
MAAPTLPDSFVHLHVHTEYSLLDGAVRIDELIAKAVKLKMPAVAMTDHGNLYGCIDFYQAAKKAKIKPIIGCELYVAPKEKELRKEVPGFKNNYHLTVLAKNETGFKNLSKIVSRAHLDGQYYKPRTDRRDLEDYSEGLIVLSGCLNSEINESIRGGQLDHARSTLEWFKERWADDFYLELHDHINGDVAEAQRKCTVQLLEWAKEYNIKPVAANDVHFLDRTDHGAHDVMICIGTGKMVFDENRMKYSEEVYFKTPKEMHKLFKHVPQALWSTLEIADKVDLTIKLDSTSSEKYPQFDAPDGSPREEFFRRQCKAGLEVRFGEKANEPDMQERLEYEMGIMEKMGFLSYFLIVWDFIKWAKDNGIPVGPGRGSAAGSLVAYALGITDCDPLRFSLIFERFLNPERISPPDIDVDFCQTRRPEVIDYVRKKYGERCVSHIITFGTLGAKSVIRDCGRVLGMSYGDTDRVAKMIPTELNIDLASAKKKNPDLKAAIENDKAVAKLYETAEKLEGLTRGVGIHAAGIVIGSQDLSDFLPLTRGNADEVVTQLAMSPLTELGMLKMDFLGLKTLTVIDDAVKLIHRHTPDFRIATLPLDDQPTFELLSRGATIAVFQLESGGMANMCKNFGVESIDHIIALIALYRPGPMDLIPDFIARKKGTQKVEYLHPLLEDVSRETYGILIYQEQVQKAANLLAGYSLGAADLLRRAMGKKDPEKMAQQRKIFVKGCEDVNKIPEKRANEIFDLLEKFAGYGFNKSHSAAYGLVTYQTGWLKANYPVEFMCGVLSNEISNTDKIAVFVGECQAMGMAILPPNVNRSGVHFLPEEISGKKRGVRYGLAAIKGVGEAACGLMLAERDAAGEFKSLEDFARRVDSKGVNRRILESLIRAGAFDWSGEERAQLFSRIETAIAAGASAQRDRAAGQFSLFGDELDAVPVLKPSANQVKVEPWSAEKMLDDEKELLGFYVSGHPLDPWRPVVDTPAYRRLGFIEEIPERDRRSKLKFAGLVSSVQLKYTKSGKQFVIMRIEDFTGSSELTLWSEEYEKFGKGVEKGSVIEIIAKVEKDNMNDSLKLTAQGIKPLPMPAAGSDAGGGNGGRGISAPGGSDGNGNAAGYGNGNGNGHGSPGSHGAPGMTKAPAGPRALTLRLDSGRDSVADLRRIQSLILQYPGDTPVIFRCVAENGARLEITAGPRFRIDAADELIEGLSPWI